MRGQFIATLENMGGKSGNTKLLRTLISTYPEAGWTFDKYKAVLTDLVQAGIVVKGRGRGGTVSASSLTLMTAVWDRMAAEVPAVDLTDDHS